MEDRYKFVDNLSVLETINLRNIGIPSFNCKQQVPSDLPIGAKPNLYCEAIELVCGGSPIGCGLVERKAQDRVKWEG